MPETIVDQEVKLHSRISIVVFSTLLSTIFGVIMYCQNLAASGKGSQRTQVIAFGFVWQFLITKLLRDATGNLALSVFLPNLVGGILLAKPFWNYHFSDMDNVQKRSIWTPLSIVIILYGLIIGLNLIR